jgi:thymidylate kinase
MKDNHRENIEIRNMLTKIQKLIQDLNENGISYCHWKSNSSLSEVLVGQTDVDLLVRRKDADSFRIIMNQLSFRPATMQVGESFPAVEHYFGLDHETGILVHVHAYFQVITGESLAKNFHLPIEKMLLKNLREEDSVRVPTKSAELVVFTVRMMLKHTSLVELVLLARDWKHIPQEIEWLLEGGSLDESVELVRSWLPSVDVRVFSECVAALKSPAPLMRRMQLGLRLRSMLRIYSRHSAIWAALSGWQKLSIMAFRRLTRFQRGMIPQSGGAVIAFVGPEATGKSTLLAEVKNWLGEHLVVEQIHAGKPRSTLLTLMPNILLPALRYLLPTSRSNQIETSRLANEQSKKSQEVYPLIFAIRSVLLAYDRRALLTRAFSRASNGSIILCDRYPSLSKEAPDGSQLQHFDLSPNRYPIRHFLARVEKRLYQEIPMPDLVISLSVPMEVALMRNKTRGKEEPEEYVRLRHSQTSNPNFGNTPVCNISTDQPLEQTVLEVKKTIWESL